MLGVSLGGRHKRSSHVCLCAEVYALCMWEILSMFVCMCGRVFHYFWSIESWCCCMVSAALVSVQQNRMCRGKEGDDGRKQKRVVWGGGLLGGGCLSQWIGSGWFTSSGHWWMPLPCCKTSSYGPAWTLGALCPTLAGNLPPKVLLPPH